MTVLDHTAIAAAVCAARKHAPSDLMLGQVYKLALDRISVELGECMTADVRFDYIDFIRACAVDLRAYAVMPCAHVYDDYDSQGAKCSRCGMVEPEPVPSVEDQQ